MNKILDSREIQGLIKENTQNGITQETENCVEASAKSTNKIVSDDLESALERLEKGENLYHLLNSIENKDADFIDFLIKRSTKFVILQEKNSIDNKNIHKFILYIGEKEVNFEIKINGEISLRVPHHQYYKSIKLSENAQNTINELLK